MRFILLMAPLVLIGYPQTAPSPAKNEQEHSKREVKPPNKIPNPAAEPASPGSTPEGQPTKNPQASDNKEKARTWPTWSDIFWPTWVLVIITALAVRAAIKTLGSINAQVEEMRKTGEQTDKLIAENIAQSTSMQKSVAEATRLASAMEVVSKEIAVSSKAAVENVAALKERTAQQMRAYLTVIIGSAIYQERAKGLKFEGKPIVVNTGHTPARKVSFRASAAILPAPLPEDFGFALSGEIKSSATVGAQQNAHLSAIVDDFVGDAEVEDIKSGNKGKCLWVWGIVTYEDIFGQEQSTRFCQSLFWFADGKTVYGYYYVIFQDQSTT